MKRAVLFIAVVGLSCILCVSCKKSHSPTAKHEEQAPLAFQNLTAATFDTLVLRNSKPVIVKFSKDSCFFCEKMIPLDNKVFALFSDKVDFFIVDTVSEQDLAMRFDFKTVPTYIEFFKGKEIARHSSFLTSLQTPLFDDYKKWVEDFISHTSK